MHNRGGTCRNRNFHENDQDQFQVVEINASESLAVTETCVPLTGKREVAVDKRNRERENSQIHAECVASDVDESSVLRMCYSRRHCIEQETIANVNVLKMMEFALDSF